MNPEKELCVGIIMDGNRRWAKAKGMNSTEGHKEGLNALERLLKDYDALKKEAHIAHYIFYAFSTENWKRSPEEVAALMSLFESAMKRFDELFVGKETYPRVKFIGNRDSFNFILKNEMNRLEEKTKDGEGTVCLALSYGGRDELIRAIGRAKNTPLTEQNLGEYLDTKDIPDPDIIIRTGGEHRLSNFLPWQSAYSELFFLPALWPDMTPELLKECVAQFEERERRYGA